jgi:hypothetical protein
MSTPDRALYSDARGYRNPYHSCELYRDEFAALVAPHFATVELFAQQVRAGSLIAPAEQLLRGEAAGEIFDDPPPAPGRSPRPAIYLIAVCTSARASSGATARGPGRSVYVDRSDLLLEEQVRDLREQGRALEAAGEEIARLGAWGRSLEAELAERSEQVRAAMASGASEVARRDETIRQIQTGAQEELALRDQTIRDIQAAAELEIVRRDSAISQLTQEFEERSRWAEQLDARVAERDRTLAGAMAEVRQLGEELARIRSTRIYRLLRRLGMLS